MVFEMRDKTQQKGFKNFKQLLTTTELLVHYDPAKSLSVLCYTLPFIIVAVLPHWMPNGEDRSIAFTAKALMSTEGSFCHLEKEVLAILDWVDKFSKYCFVRSY